jgi:hypothetical protein
VGCSKWERIAGNGEREGETNTLSGNMTPIFGKASEGRV